MFEHLVESTSHKDDLSRKGSFILGTIVAYAIVLTGLGILSIYLYDAQLENQNLELTTLVAPVPVPPAAEDKPADAAKPQKVTTDQQVDVRKELMLDVSDTRVAPKEVSAKGSDTPPMRKGVLTQLGSGNSNADLSGGPVGSGTGGIPGGTGTGTGGQAVEMEAPPPAPPTPKPVPKAPISGGVLNGKALSLPKPAYPAIAKTARASGTVVVQVTIDENGSVISANAISGPPLLRAAAVQAARGARFSPTKLSGQPVKVTGVINFNFTLQ
ncbi:MAG TPA: TonB family protein [Pyrinomonadaceae bacterium]|jgi:protein TonB